MTTVNDSQNLNAHYAATNKVKRPDKVVVQAPEKIPTNRLFSDVSANKKMEAICNDIYVDTKKEERKEGKNFTKYFVGIVLAIIALMGLKKLFK